MRLRRESGTKIKPSSALRRLFKEGPLPLVGVWGATAHHAQLAENAGFKFFGLSGSDVSTQLLGLPDAGFLTLTELVNATRWVCGATSLPVVVDCDTGFGNAITVHRTTEEVILAGAACLFIEDQEAPKRCGFVKGKMLISVEEAAGKLRAACSVRDRLDPDFMIMARTDARGAVGGGMDEVIRRGKAYLEAGADIFYASALQNREELNALRTAFPDALLEVMPLATKPPLSQKEAEELRVATCGVHIGRIGAVLMHDFLREYAARGEDAVNDFANKHQGHPLNGLGLLDLTGFPHLLELEEKYLPAEMMEKYEQSIGVYDPRAGQKGRKTSQG
jgi:2-methylisocitrate lyase-like PEP mutase family enzyme